VKLALSVRRRDFAPFLSPFFLASETHIHGEQWRLIGIRGSIITMTTIVLLTISNIFMTFAWYGHLKYRNVPLFKVILISWLIAFAEYCFQVPANRIGSYEFTGVQLKTIQEVITLTVFSVFSVLYLGEKLRWNYLLGFGLMVSAVFVIFKK
jgi:uncharacterized protein